MKLYLGYQNTQGIFKVFYKLIDSYLLKPRSEVWIGMTKTRARGAQPELGHILLSSGAEINALCSS